MADLRIERLDGFRVTVGARRRSRAAANAGAAGGDADLGHERFQRAPGLDERPTRPSWVQRSRIQAAVA
jgi:hypothetical protein